MRVFHPESVSSILVMRLYFIGDVLLSTPVFESLKRRFPEARVTALVKRRALDVLRGNPWIDEVLLHDEEGRGGFRLGLELRRRRFDVAVDLTGDLRTSWLLYASDPGFRVGFNHAGFGFLLDRRIAYRSEGHVVDHLMSAVAPLGVTGDAPSPAIYPDDADAASAAGLLADAGLAEAPYVVMSPGGNWSHRRWPAARFGEVAAFAADAHGLRSLVIGSSDDAPIAAEVVEASCGAAVNVAGRTGIRELAVLASDARAFVGNDSGPMHVAAAAGCPVVALFGPNTPVLFGPRGSPSRVIWHEYECSPCDQKRCARADRPCIEEITVSEVEEALSSLLTETAGRAAGVEGAASADARGEEAPR